MNGLSNRYIMPSRQGEKKQDGIALKRCVRMLEEVARFYYEVPDESAKVPFSTLLSLFESRFIVKSTTSDQKTRWKVPTSLAFTEVYPDIAINDQTISDPWTHSWTHSSSNENGLSHCNNYDNQTTDIKTLFDYKGFVRDSNPKRTSNYRYVDCKVCGKQMQSNLKTMKNHFFSNKGETCQKVPCEIRAKVLEKNQESNVLRELRQLVEARDSLARSNDPLHHQLDLLQSAESGDTGSTRTLSLLQNSELEEMKSKYISKRKHCQKNKLQLEKGSVDEIDVGETDAEGTKINDAKIGAAQTDGAEIAPVNSSPQDDGLSKSISIMDELLALECPALPSSAIEPLAGITDCNYHLSRAIDTRTQATEFKDDLKK